MGRYDELRRILDRGEYFKVVCGAGNEDPQEVYRLSLVYTLAGASGIDVSANTDVVRASMRGIHDALAMAPLLGIAVGSRPFITVSVGIKGDPHVRKARIIAARCTACGACREVCDQKALTGNPCKVVARRCIGCGKCADVCAFEAVEFFTRKVDLDAVLPRCLEAGAETLELHAIVPDDAPVMRDWQRIARILPRQFVSMCLDQSQLSHAHLIDRVRQAGSVAGERLVIQADGAPMSGGRDDYQTTLQAVACADVVRKAGLAVKILLSGGTNSKTGELAELCGVAVHGVSVGTFARNLVRDEIEQPGFPADAAAVARAARKGRQLVDANIERIRR